MLRILDVELSARSWEKQKSAIRGLDLEVIAEAAHRGSDLSVRKLSTEQIKIQGRQIRTALLRAGFRHIDQGAIGFRLMHPAPKNLVKQRMNLVISDHLLQVGVSAMHNDKLRARNDVQPMPA